MDKLWKIMKNHKGEYLRIVNRFESRRLKLIRENEKEVKKFIKKRALACGVDLIHTQHSLSTNLPYKDELKRKKFQAFQDFVYTLSDEYRVGFYYIIENGKFKWL